MHCYWRTKRALILSVKTHTDPFAGTGLAGYPRCALGARDGDAADQRYALSRTEKDRVARLKDDGRKADLEGSLSLRRVLIAALAGCDAWQVCLSADTDGAPVLTEPEGYAVSISNKGPYTFVALDPLPGAIGADVEIVRETNWRAMLDMVCGDEERAAFLSRHAGTAALPDFFRMWTIKEAILKATGEGFRAGPKLIRVPDSFYDGAAQGEVAAFGAVFGVWAVQQEKLAFSLARTLS